MTTKAGLSLVPHIQCQCEKVLVIESYPGMPHSDSIMDVAERHSNDTSSYKKFLDRAGVKTIVVTGSQVTYLPTALLDLEVSSDCPYLQTGQWRAITLEDARKTTEAQ
ncbi:hypothetical protein GYMLUDRAFT_614714 [Collybiopsis luxurians FD-317 M1]|uniref:Uncharacterized protein n=1 Tax=Collybiopsis luxurians FD-317 M1 TaxID=944289 RepID=A0A0D0CVX0_9AGAR|nr:hypothetical protein GYMLUDRAFT_614714 [Collybiopsis luxurians FD-317 M1]